MKFVIDTSALMSGMVLPPYYEYYAPSSLQKEIDRNDLEPYINICYIDPEKSYVERVRRVCEETGDLSKLSKEDIEVLALALQLGLPILTEDFSIQNVASHLSISFYGIKRIKSRIKWRYRCVGCYRRFKDYLEQCPACGSKVKKFVREKSKVLSVFILILLVLTVSGYIAEGKESYGYAQNSIYFNFDRYISYEEMVSRLYEIAHSKPEIVNVSVLGTTYGWNSSSQSYSTPRKILLVKISDNVTIDEDEPEILIDALHHAREWLSVMVVLYAIEKIVSEYNSNDTITWLVNNREIYFIPMLNPDGYVYDGNGDLSATKRWRKNCRDNDGDGVFEHGLLTREGVDLNRNYEFYWEYGNSNPNSDDYRGPTAFSEPETKAIRDFAKNHTINLYITYHSYGSAILIPPGCSESMPRPYDYLEFSIAENMTVFQKYSKYDVIKSTDLYPSPGTSEDWFLHVERAISFTIELEGNGWYPPQTSIRIACENNVDSMIYAIMVGDLNIREGFPSKPYIVWGYVHYKDMPVVATNLHTGENVTVMPMKNGFYMINLGLLSNYTTQTPIRISNGNLFVDINVDARWGKRVDLEAVPENISLIHVTILLAFLVILSRRENRNI